MEFKIPKEVVDFYIQNGTVVEGIKINTYAFMPFWLEIIDKDKGIVKFHSLGNVPKVLKDVVLKHRDEKEDL